MWLDAPVDFLIQYWPYAVVAASVVVLVLLWKRVRSVEAEMERMRADLVQVQQLQ